MRCAATSERAELLDSRPAVQHFRVLSVEPRSLVRSSAMPDNAPNRHSGTDSDSLIVFVAAGSATSLSLWTRLHGDGGRQLGATAAGGCADDY